MTFDQSQLPPDPDPKTIAVPCIRARQPVGDIFVAAIPFKDLIAVTFFDVRRVLQEERDFERYLGIQRPLDTRRVKQLSQYVNFADASFPSSIIVSLEQDYVSFENNTLTISNCKIGESKPSIAFRKIGRVLDGQHRIAGLEFFNGDHFDLSVTIFVGADISDQAHIFATVNLEQTKVNKSLVYDLYELSKSRSPQQTCHNIAVALDRDADSPFYQRIKRLGMATDGRPFETITQATFVEGLLQHISDDPRADRDFLLKGNRLKKLSNEEINKFPLRNMFIDELDIEVTQIVFNYFKAVEKRWPDAWKERGRGWMLNRTNGIRALLRFFRNAYLKVATPGDVPSVDRFLNHVFKGIDVRDDQFSIDNFVPGTSGEARLLNVLKGKERV
ncbi:MAG: DGQHR domain-containing protein [Rhodospirillales bacterium]|nr:DGQHR domain-containing protein [Rhodospirillales bacterium]